MVSEIDLWIVIPSCTLMFFSWVGLYVYMTLTVMKNDPREIQYRKDSGDEMGILPEKLFSHRKKGNAQ